MSANTPPTVEHGGGRAQRAVVVIERVALGMSALAILALTFIGGLTLGLSMAEAPEPQTILVTVEHEPTAAERQAQAEAEVEAYNRGIEAGKFLANDPADIELKTR